MKIIRILLVLLLVAVPLQGMNPGLEDGGQGFDLSTLPTDLIFRLVHFSSPATRNVVTKVNKLFKQLWGRSVTLFFKSEGPIELSMVDSMALAYAIMCMSNSKFYRTIMTKQVYDRCPQEFLDIIACRSWGEVNDKRKPVESFISQDAPQKMLAVFNDMVQTYPERDPNVLMNGGAVRKTDFLKVFIVYGARLNSEQSAGIISRFCKGTKSNDGTDRVLLELCGMAANYLDMAILSHRIELIKAMLNNTDYAGYLKDQKLTTFSWWPTLLKHACIYPKTETFQLLVDWLVTNLGGTTGMPRLLDDAMYNIIDINKHQYLRILLEGCKQLSCFKTCVNERVWSAFVREKYDSVDTLLEYINSTEAFQSKSAMPERMYRCQQVLDRVFMADEVPNTLFKDIFSFLRLGRQADLKMLLEKVCKFSYFDELATYMLYAELKSKNYESVRMILACRGDSVSNGTNRLGLDCTHPPDGSWVTAYLDQVREDNDVRSYVNFIELLFWPLRDKKEFSVEESQGFEELFFALGAMAIARNDGAWLQELLKVHTRNPTFFNVQLSLLLAQALEKKQYENIAHLLTAGALLNGATSRDCLYALLKASKEPTIPDNVVVTDYIKNLQEDRPDLFVTLVSMAQKFHSDQLRHHRQEQMVGALFAAVMQANIAQVIDILSTADIGQFLIEHCIKLAHTEIEKPGGSENVNSLTLVGARLIALNKIIFLLGEYSKKRC